MAVAAHVTNETARSEAVPKDEPVVALLPVLRDLYIDLVRADGPDLTARQLSLFLLVHMETGPHTVRGMAAKLDISKPAVTRAVDRMELLDLLKRRPDPEDRRSVLIGRTMQGRSLLATIKSSLPKDLKLPSSRPKGS